ncbi:hypothetical protein ABZ078_02070 [Streptomyces sp. NPDC006385]|uniref:hypothetical protein n=1 Tax=Streptomyces sp. NPDC006385 TaxID=3156761 RepID=UPI0033BCA463
MRRTARALSVAALSGAVVGFAASAACADPAVEVSPGTVSPGGSVTVEVSCDPVDGAPDTVDATSQAFEEGTVALKRVSGDEGDAGPAYSGTATVPPAENFEGDPDAAGADSAWTVDGTCPAAAGDEGKPWSATLTVALDDGAGTHGGGGADGSGGAADHGADGGAGGAGGTVGGEGGADHGTEGGTGGTDGGRGGTDGGTGDTGGTAGGGVGAPDGTDRHCTEPHAGKAEPGGTASHGSASEHHSGRSEHHSGRSEHHSGSSEAHPEDCGSAAVEHGVRAGQGGAFTDSVPALVAGGLLIATALGGAVYRLCRRTPTGEG